MVEIIEHFQGLMHLHTDSGLSVRPPEHFDQEEQVSKYIDLMKRRVFDGREFFSNFEYEWMLNPKSYSSLFECQMQWSLIDSIADVRPSHPNYKNFGNICVRESITLDIECSAIRSGEFRYVVISSGYVRLVKEFIVTFALMREGTDLSKAKTLKSDESTENAGIYDELNSTEIVELTKTHEKRASEICLQFTGILDQLLTGESPTLVTPPIVEYFNYPEAAKFGSLAFYMNLVHSIDMFIVFHEFVHLVDDGYLSENRDIDHEKAADNGALSLLIILTSRQPVLRPYLGICIPAVFQILRILIQRKTDNRVRHYLSGEREALRLFESGNVSEFFKDIASSKSADDEADREICERFLSLIDQFEHFGMPQHVELKSQSLCCSQAFYIPFAVNRKMFFLRKYGGAVDAVLHDLTYWHMMSWR